MSDEQAIGNKRCDGHDWQINFRGAELTDRATSLSTRYDS